MNATYRWPNWSGSGKGSRNRWLLALVGSALISCLSYQVLVSKTSNSDELATKGSSREDRTRAWQVFASANNVQDEDEAATRFEHLQESSTKFEGREDSKARIRKRRRRKRRSSGSMRSNGERKPILNEFSFPPNLVQGMRFVLMCQILDGEPPIQIKWFKGNQEIGNNNNNQQDTEASAPQPELVATEELGASLLFRRVQAQHSGNYTCTASNHFGTASYSSSVSVKVPPTWKVEPQDQHSMMGEQISIDCQASGNPNPFIRWKFQQQQLANPTGSAELGTRTNEPSAASDPQAAPNQHPLQANTNFKLINSNHHVQTLENGSLAIRQVGREHDGLYLCEADNGLEPSLMKIVRLTVHQQAHFNDDIQLLGPSDLLYSPSSIHGASSLENHPHQQQQQPVVRYVKLPTTVPNHTNKAAASSSSSASIKLLCLPIGEPPLTLDWMKDSQLLHSHESAHILTAGLVSHTPSPSTHIQVSARRNARGQLESELKLIGLRRSDAGLYTCSARNSFGRAERQLRLVLQEAPEAPQVVDVAHIGSRSVALRWLAPFDGNSPILRYLVEYRKLPDDPIAEQQMGDSTLHTTEMMSMMTSEKLMPQGKQLELLGPLTGNQVQIQHTVHELEPLTRYSMHVVAVNGIARSKASVALSLRTEEEVPSVVPSLVEAVILSSDSIKLRWSISYSPAREIIDGFFLGYRSLEPPAISSSSSSSASLLADSQVASSSSSSSSSAAAAGLAGASSNLNSEQSQSTFTYKTIRLSNRETLTDIVRDSPPGAQLDSGQATIAPISSVSKTIQTGLGDHSVVSQGLLLNSFEYEISGLERNTEYTIFIQCFNRKGAGPASDSIVFKTLLDDPPNKLALIADEITESSVKLTWRFIDPRSLHGKSTRQNSELVDGFVLTFAKLLPSLSQSKKLAQPNELLTAGQAARVSHALPGNVPSNSLVTSVAEQWQAVQMAPQQRSHQLKNLDCGASYAIKIWAFNKLSNGQPSDLLTVRTRGKAPIPPDRRSFISINSTAIRLHLSAWYDGGCEINKFVIQYRARGQQEWLLLSNNILKEQVTVNIRDLLPASPYELLVVAYNQVGPTEVKYRFTTLDLEGRTVPQPTTGGSHSFLSGSQPTLDDQELDENGELYLSGDDSNGSIRREHWQEAGLKSLQAFRQLFGSPVALVVSLCLFTALLLLAAFFRFNKLASSSASSPPDLSRSKSPGAARQQHQHKTRKGDQMNGLTSSATLLPSGLTYTPTHMTSDNDSSARIMSNRQLGSNSRPFHGFIPQSEASAECHYGGSLFCGPTVNGNEYGTNLVHHHEYPPQTSIYGTSQEQRQHHQQNYATVQHSHSQVTPINRQEQPDNLHSIDQKQQCLIQMLIMGAGSNVNSEALCNSSEQTAVDSSSYAHALNTLARQTNIGKLAQHPSPSGIYSDQQICEHQQSFSHPLSGNNNQQFMSGKNQQFRSSSLRDQSNLSSSSQYNLIQQTKTNGDNMVLGEPILGETFTTNYHQATLGRQTTGVSLVTTNENPNSDLVDSLSSASNRLLLNSQQQAIDSSHSSSGATSSFNSEHQQYSHNQSLLSNSSSCLQDSAPVTHFDQKNCDILSQYDVPFKFNTNANHEPKNQEQKNICY